MHVYSRSLIEVDVCLYGTPSLAEKYLSGFPHSLQGAPCYCRAVDRGCAVGSMRGWPNMSKLPCHR